MKYDKIGVQIDEKNTFDKALKTGINLFLGSGFSVLAKDAQGKALPCGRELLYELIDEFPRASAFNDLGKAIIT